VLVYMSYGGKWRLCLHVLWGKIEIVLVCMSYGENCACMSHGKIVVVCLMGETEDCVFMPYGRNCACIYVLWGNRASMSYGKIVLVCLMGETGDCACMSYGEN
jgi:hypothetical protein